MKMSRNTYRNTLNTSKTKCNTMSGSKKVDLVSFHFISFSYFLFSLFLLFLFLAPGVRVSDDMDHLI